LSSDQWRQHEAKATQKFERDKKKKKKLWVACPVCTHDNKYNNKKCSNCGLKLKIIGSA
jgi:hypothetical protein